MWTDEDEQLWQEYQEMLFFSYKVDREIEELLVWWPCNNEPDIWSLLQHEAIEYDDHLEDAKGYTKADLLFGGNW